MSTDQRWPHTLKAGCKAYLDTMFNGLVPCKVIKITSTYDRLLGRDRVEAEIEVSKDQGAFKKGMKEVFPTGDVVPCGAVHHKQFSTTIHPYNVEVTK